MWTLLKVNLIIGNFFYLVQVSTLELTMRNLRLLHCESFLFPSINTSNIDNHISHSMNLRTNSRIVEEIIPRETTRESLI